MKKTLQRTLSILALIFFITPIILLVIMSFSQNEYLVFPPQNFSLKWYVNFFNNPSWLNATLHSIIIAFFSAIFSTVLATILSFIIKKISLDYKNIVLIILFIPIIIPFVVMGTGLLLLFSDVGLVDTLLGVILAHSLICTPFAFISIYPALTHISSTYELSARNLGASFPQTLNLVYIPLLKYNLLLGYLIAFLSSLNEVVIILFLTGKNIIPLSYKIWEGFRYEINPTINVAAIFLLITSIIIIYMNYLLSTKKGEGYET